MNISFMNLTNDDRILFDFTWISFKSYVEDNYPKDQNPWEWSYPIYKSNYDTIEELADVVIQQKPDVFALSLYIWNAGVSLRVAEIIKTKLPECIIIVGGPHQEYLEDWYYKKHWYIDFNSKTDGYGESCINEFLHQVETDRNWKEVPFLIINDNGVARHSPKFFNKRQFAYPKNIYGRNKDYIKHFKENAKEDDVIFASYETSRGCPYGCSYCEWGGGTNTKVTFKPLDIVKQDLEFLLGEAKVDILAFTDANFGISKNDIKIIEEVVRLKHLTGYPKTIFFYGPTKTNKKNLFLIEDMLLDAGIFLDLKADVQDLNADVMENIDRPADDIHEMMREYKEKSSKYGFEYRAEFIRGLPGTTLNDFYDSLDLVHEYGADIQRHTFIILTTTPASKKEYREKYKLVTKRTRQIVIKTEGTCGDLIVLNNANNEVDQLTYDPKYTLDFEVVVGTLSYTLEDYIEMFLVDQLYDHSKKMLHPLLKYFGSNRKVSEFYREYYNGFLQGDYLSGIQKIIVENFIEQVRSKILGDDIIDYFEYHALPKQLPFNIVAKANIHMNMLANLNRKEYYNAISKWMDDTFGHDPIRDDLVDWMVNSYISIDYDPNNPTPIQVNYNWNDWYHDDKELKEMSCKIIPKTTHFLGKEIEWNNYTMGERVKKYFVIHSNEKMLNGIYFHKEYEVAND